MKPGYSLAKVLSQTVLGHETHTNYAGKSIQSEVADSQITPKSTHDKF